ncbi:amidase [Nocardia panacis]|uniref:amidase n=1 Tax=Nocardia panacis TaxID=2340916 RepID=A0A3A4KB49_9NOCA|nr:amidase [Nocardia panacis]RJO70821.1 amidase [Nocardia panacis]
MSTSRLHAFTDDAMGDLDATGIAARIAAGEVTAREVVAAAIARAERVGPSLGAFACTDFERALAACDNLPSGPFTGVPTAIKDNTGACGLPTQCGTATFEAAPATVDGEFSRQLLDAGMVALGKSRLPEFAFNITTEFTDKEPARNPWDTGRSTGGSSGGAAALVAAGIVPIAHATDAGGSIRIPAAACGLVGLKPSRGRTLVDAGDRIMPVKVAVQGVLSRSVRDTARVMAEAERRYRNPALPPIRAVEGAGRTRLRIGVVTTSPTGSSFDAPTRASIDASIALLTGLGHRVEETTLPVPADYWDTFGKYLGLFTFAFKHNGRRMFGPDFDHRKLENNTRGLADLFRRNAARTPQMLYRLRRIGRQYVGMFTRYDVLLSPVVGHITPELGYHSPAQEFESWFERVVSYDCLAPLNNISGTPAISLPLHAADSGIPLGALFAAAPGDERTLLELAFELEEASPWRRITD